VRLAFINTRIQHLGSARNALSHSNWSRANVLISGGIGPEDQLAAPSGIPTLLETNREGGYRFPSQGVSGKALNVYYRGE
jgi:hypothetical protein